jgi:opacity protein-like surface antigen
MKKLLLTVAALSLTAAPAFADDAGSYVNLGVSKVAKDAGWALAGRWGYNFEGYFGVEGEGHLGITSQESDTLPGVDLKLKNSLAGYVTARMPLSEETSLFVRGGYHTTSIKVSGPGVSGSADVDGLAFGAGINYMYNENAGIRLEYTGLKDGDTTDVISLGYVYKF